MGTRKRSALLAVLTLALGGVLFTAPTASASDEIVVTPQHAITCGWLDVPPPYGATSTAVAGFVRVVCSDRLDDANTRAQIQRFVGGAWRDHGAAVVSYSTGATYSGGWLIHVYDSAGKAVGDWYYRMSGRHFGQHGNIWALPPYYSGPRSLTRNG